LIRELDLELVEMKNSRSKGLCCGAGGAQMFKEPERGNKDINIQRTEEALDTTSDIIAVACPFCNIMISDGVKSKENDIKTKVADIAELIAKAEDF
jgi:Fe-S oxidoreductase